MGGGVAVRAALTCGVLAPEAALAVDLGALDRWNDREGRVGAERARPATFAMLHEDLDRLHGWYRQPERLAGVDPVEAHGVARRLLEHPSERVVGEALDRGGVRRLRRWAGEATAPAAARVLGAAWPRALAMLTRQADGAGALVTETILRVWASLAEEPAESLGAEERAVGGRVRRAILGSGEHEQREILVPLGRVGALLDGGAELPAVVWPEPLVDALLGESRIRGEMGARRGARRFADRIAAAAAVEAPARLVEWRGRVAARAEGYGTAGLGELRAATALLRRHGVRPAERAVATARGWMDGGGVRGMQRALACADLLALPEVQGEVRQRLWRRSADAGYPVESLVVDLWPECLRSASGELWERSALALLERPGGSEVLDAALLEVEGWQLRGVERGALATLLAGLSREGRLALQRAMARLAEPAGGQGRGRG